MSAARCTAEVAFRDFDGSIESMPCDRPATRRLLLAATYPAAWLAASGEPVTFVVDVCDEHEHDEHEPSDPYSDVLVGSVTL